MAMTKLVNEVTQLVDAEYNRAAEQHGKLHHSMHEAYAVMKEELEEAQERFKYVDDYINEFYWRAAKNDYCSSCRKYAGDIKEQAILAAAEMIQVAAMAQKAMLGFETDKAEVTS